MDLTATVVVYADIDGVRHGTCPLLYGLPALDMDIDIVPEA